MSRRSDLVKDSRLETRFYKSYTKHRFYESDLARVERAVVREEYWKRGKYLGSGAYGRVWLEHCVRGSKNQDVRAVKEIRKLEDCNKACNFDRELEAIAKFSHDRYVRCFVKSHGWFEDDECLYIAMEYVTHGDLHKHMSASSPLPEEEVQVITYQLLEGLTCLHENGFAHRDLKPSNILVKARPPEPWWVKIGDFGISKRVEDNTGGQSTRRGTLAFMAPELHGIVKNADRLEEKSVAFQAADMWSLGEVTFQLLTKQPSFRNISVLFAFVENPDLFPMTALQDKNTSQLCTDLLRSILQPSPKVRMLASQALLHPWVAVCGPPTPKAASINSFELFDSQNEVEAHDMDFSESSAEWSIVSEPVEPQTHLTTWEMLTANRSPTRAFPNVPNTNSLEQLAVRPQKVRSASTPETKQPSPYLESSSRNPSTPNSAPNFLGRLSDNDDHWTVTQAHSEIDSPPPSVHVSSNFRESESLLIRSEQSRQADPPRPKPKSRQLPKLPQDNDINRGILQVHKNHTSDLSIHEPFLPSQASAMSSPSSLGYAIAVSYNHNDSYQQAQDSATHPERHYNDDRTSSFHPMNDQAPNAPSEKLTKLVREKGPFLISFDGKGQVLDCDGNVAGCIDDKHRDEMAGEWVELIVDNDGGVSFIALDNGILHHMPAQNKIIQSTSANPDIEIPQQSLFNGNLVLDVPMSGKFLHNVQHVEPPERDEFTHLRYTAVTSAPKDFTRDKYLLRQALFNRQRTTEVLVVIKYDWLTTNNALDTLLGDAWKTIVTLNGSKAFSNEVKPQDVWKSVVVALIGPALTASRHANILKCYGLDTTWHDTEEMHFESVNGNPVTAHLYEYSSQTTWTSSAADAGYEKLPMQLMLCCPVSIIGTLPIEAHDLWRSALAESLHVGLCVTYTARGPRPSETLARLWKLYRPLNPRRTRFATPIATGTLSEVSRHLMIT